MPVSTGTPGFTYAPDSPIGLVRLLLNDVDLDALVFTDAEIGAFLTLEVGVVKRAAAQAIDTNATNEILASKVLKDHELTTDGAKAADAMRKHADSLRAQADVEYANSDDASFFSVVDPGMGYRPELTGWY